MIEIWKDINGYEGLYQVSSFGQVKSLGRITESKNQTKTFNFRRKEIMLRQCINHKGYCAVVLQKKQK